MFSFNEFIKLEESLDSTPVRWKMLPLKNYDGGYAHYSFPLENEEIHVFFEGELDDRGVAISFGSINPNKKNINYSLTGSGQQFKVLATVMDIIKDYIKQKNPTRLEFTADKGISDDSDSKSRVSVYTRMIKKYMPKEWSLSVKDLKWNMYFLLQKN